MSTDLLRHTAAQPPCRSATLPPSHSAAQPHRRLATLTRSHCCPEAACSAAVAGATPSLPAGPGPGAIASIHRAALTALDPSPPHRGRTRPRIFAPDLSKRYFALLMNSTRRNLSADQSSSIATARTVSKPAFRNSSQPVSRLKSHWYFLEVLFG